VYDDVESVQVTGKGQLLCRKRGALIISSLFRLIITELFGFDTFLFSIEIISAQNCNPAGKVVVIGCVSVQ